MQIGETLAELVRENKFSQLMVLDIISGALVEHPGDMERARCFGCLAAFYMRLASFHPGSIIPMDDRVVENCRVLLPQLLPEVRFCLSRMSTASVTGCYELESNLKECKRHECTLSRVQLLCEAV